VPVNNGSRPGAPLGGHSTKVAPVPEDPVAVAAPAVEVDPPPRDTPDPPELVPPLVLPVVPVVEAVPVLPPALPPALPVVPVVEVVEDDVVPPVAAVEVEVDVVVPTAEVEVVPAAEVEVVPAAEVEVVPAAEVEVVPDEFCTVGKATAPPPAGKPLRSVALPTPPVVGVAVCARAAETRPMDSRKANPALRIMAGYIMRQRPPWRERSDQTA
jgi:hypothetical protein